MIALCFKHMEICGIQKKGTHRELKEALIPVLLTLLALTGGQRSSSKLNVRPTDFAVTLWEAMADLLTFSNPLIQSKPVDLGINLFFPCDTGTGSHPSRPNEPHTRSWWNRLNYSAL